MCPNEPTRSCLSRLLCWCGVRLSSYAAHRVLRVNWGQATSWPPSSRAPSSRCAPGNASEPCDASYTARPCCVLLPYLTDCGWRQAFWVMAICVDKTAAHYGTHEHYSGETPHTRRTLRSLVSKPPPESPAWKIPDGQTPIEGSSGGKLSALSIRSRLNPKPWRSESLGGADGSGGAGEAVAYGGGAVGGAPRGGQLPRPALRKPEPPDRVAVLACCAPRPSPRCRRDSSGGFSRACR